MDVVLRWIARLLATAMSALFLLFLVGEGLPSPGDLTGAERLGLAATLAMIVGSAAGWWRDLAGAALLLGGYLLFALAERGWPPLPFAAFALAGAGLLTARLVRAIAQRRPPASAAAAAPDPAPAAAPSGTAEPRAPAP